MRQQFLLPGENLSILSLPTPEPSCRVLVFTQRYRLQATLDSTTTIAAGRCTPLLTIWLTRFVAKGKAGGLTPASLHTAQLRSWRASAPGSSAPVAGS